MKKLAVIFTLTLLFSFNVYADVCVDVSEYIATKAVNILKKQKEIYNYCSICEDAKPQTISIKNIAMVNAAQLPAYYLIVMKGIF